MKKPKHRIYGKILKSFSLNDIEQIALDNLKAFGVNEKPEDVYVYVSSQYDHDGEFRMSLTIQEYKFESDAECAKRLKIEEESKLAAKNKKLNKEAAERKLLEKLKKKYEKS